MTKYLMGITGFVYITGGVVEWATSSLLFSDASRDLFTGVLATWVSLLLFREDRR